MDYFLNRNMNYRLQEISDYFILGNVFVFKKSNAYIEDMIANYSYPKVYEMRLTISKTINFILIK